MTIGNATGTNTVPGRWSAGETHVALGKYTFAAAVADADTINWASILPAGGIEVIDVTWYGVELDTNSTPTLQIDLGDGTDQDGFINGASVGLAAAGLNQVIAKGDGALMGTRFTGATSVKATFGNSVATAASSGDVWIAITYNCVGKV